ncbi:hypothetical protein COU76_05445 [Candidatus Peregrinibacteria bacterium CG10_big_fil_rev_8_21_14_0_10_49_10]|nr:MAG: hypothetical protein COU76_05445 [Candidatus Peregrinibacteria bacterium CG10_big_fil_rev_8_21_14_0_10_49_10]
MYFLPIRTGILRKGDFIAQTIAKECDLQNGDIVAVSAKACAVCEGAAIDLSQVAITAEATDWAERCGRSPAFRQAVLDETERMHGIVVSSCPLAMLCDLQPDGLSEGSILAVNAGLDESNIGEGFAIGWPKDPVATVQNMQDELQKISGKHIAVILTDSCCRPGRLGVTALALCTCGIDPLLSQIGKPDLFGHKLTMTHEATADQLATAANFLMGNADQSTPAVILREHGLSLSDFCGWVPGIERNEDMFQGVFENLNSLT